MSNLSLLAASVHIRPLLAAVTVLAVLICGVWLLRGGVAAVRVYAAVAAGILVIGLAHGNVIQISAGLVLLAVDAWVLWSLWRRGCR